MKIKQHIETHLWVREDGAVLMPPSNRSQFKKYRWSFGCDINGYRIVGFQRKRYFVHRLVAESFLGRPPKDKPYVDHINRVRSDNHISNLRWASAKENNDNTLAVEEAFNRLGVRACENPLEYSRIYRKNNREKLLLHAKGWRSRRHS